MRKTMFRVGWAILFMLPIVFLTEAVIEQDVPVVQPWKWAILVGAVLMIYLTRNRDDVLKHHVA